MLGAVIIYVISHYGHSYWTNCLSIILSCTAQPIIKSLLRDEGRAFDRDMQERGKV